MSPEQAAGRDDIDGRADVWSVGVVLYEGLTGQLPHEAANYNALMVRILTQDVMPIASRHPGLSPKVCEIVDACLQRDRERRPTAGQLSSMLEAAVRYLRAERFRRSGGRRRDDMPPMMMPPMSEDMHDDSDRQLVVKLIAVGAASGLITGLLGVLVGYLLWH